MNDFFRFPHTPHLAWLGAGQPRGDKVLSHIEVAKLLNGEVIVEEKLDGANLGFSLGLNGEIRVQNRGQYLETPYRDQFSRLPSWLEAHRENLALSLGQNLILFGEWCAARHSLGYTRLPDWFVAFDVYDRKAGRFWSTRRRNALVKGLGVSAVPSFFTGSTSLRDVKQLLSRHHSSFSDGPLEGMVIRRENDDWLLDRAKLVQPEFTQAITEHWSRRGIEWNRVDPNLKVTPYQTLLDPPSADSESYPPQETTQAI